MKKKYMFSTMSGHTEKVISGEKDAIILPLGVNIDGYEYGIYNNKIYLSKNGRGVSDYKLPLSVDGEYYICQNGKELGIDEFRGSLKWLDRRAVGIEYLRNKFSVVSARICKFSEVTEDELSGNCGMDVDICEEEYVVVYRISMIQQ